MRGVSILDDLGRKYVLLHACRRDARDRSATETRGRFHPSACSTGGTIIWTCKTSAIDSIERYLENRYLALPADAQAEFWQHLVYLAGALGNQVRRRAV